MKSSYCSQYSKGPEMLPELATTAAVTKATNSLVGDIYSLVRKMGGNKYQAWKITSDIPSLISQLNRYRHVRTLLKPSESIDLTEFYHPTRIETSAENSSDLLKEIDSLMPDKHVVILGVVGQGKSVLLRYLATRELTFGFRIPVLIELRRCTRCGLLSAILTELSTLGLAMDEELFFLLVERKKIALLLDGFDEVSESDSERLVAEIEDLSRKCQTIPILITSRPNSPITNSPFFKLTAIKELSVRRREHLEVIERLAGKSSREEIEKQLATSSIANVLTTPLMVSLLLVRFSVEQSIPETTIAFYKDFFDLLLRRHDNLSKPGFRRERRSKLSNSQLESVFSLGAYLIRADQSTGLLFPLSTFTESIRIALDYFSINDIPDAVCQDIIRITNLVREEGGECRFVHKSVLEFHSAMAVKNMTDEAAADGYRLMLENSRSWEEEINYLSQLDEVRFKKMFLLTYLKERLGIDSVEDFSALRNDEHWLVRKIEDTQMLITLDGDGTSISMDFTNPVTPPAYFEKIPDLVSAIRDWCTNKKPNWDQLDSNDLIDIYLGKDSDTPREGCIVCTALPKTDPVFISVLQSQIIDVYEDYYRDAIELTDKQSRLPSGPLRLR
jgi:hypothetical protein